MIALLAALVLQGAVQYAPIPVQRGLSIAPDSVTVGEPFRVVVRVRAPAGATIAFPAGPDSGGVIEAVDPRQVHTTPDSTSMDQSATYRVVAWDVGMQTIPLPDVVVTSGGRERRVPLAGAQVFVRSVLPADSAKRIPKPPRALFEFGRPWWLWLLGAIAAAAILGGLLWWWWRRRRGGGEPATDPYAAAEERFDRVERLGLLEAGERGQYIALMVDVLRGYMADTVSNASVALTTNELLHAVQEDAAVPSSRLANVLAEADLVKFAARPVSSQRARELGGEARAIVHVVHEVQEARRAAARAEEEKAA